MSSLFHRTSVRQYLEKKVEKEKIEYILRGAMAAPSAGNQQPWEYYVVENKEVLEKLSQCSPYATCVKNAPLAFVACYRVEGLRFQEYAHIDMSASVENLLLAIDEQGLGGVWLGIAPIEERMKAVEEVLQMRPGLRAFAIIPCGYPVNIKPQQNRYEQSRVHFLK